MIQGGANKVVDSDSLLAAFQRYSIIPEEEWLYVQSQLNWKTVHKGQYLLHSGQSCEQIFYCERGLFRMFYENDDGSEHIKSFVTEAQFFTDYRSFLTDTPSFLSIQALEDSNYAFFSKQTAERLYERHICWERFGRRLAEHLFILKSKKERELVELSAEERYRLFLQQYPDLESRVPQYQIAAFLAISPVSLSRIRNNKFRG